jgi:flavin reductase (DIM6/NTAB) family NADH-FMN oxidoreductase RutF
MFFEPQQATREFLATLGLKHNPFLALVAPRPIGWVSTVNAQGVPNLAPFSFFNAVSSRPPMVMFCANGTHNEGGAKDSLANARATGEFVWNLSTWALRQQMNDSSAPAPHGVDEFAATGLTKIASRVVKPPRVAESPVHLECVVTQIVDLIPDEKTGAPNTVTFGRVVGIHIDDNLIVDGRVDITRARPLARLGYLDYASIDTVFEIKRPGWPIGTPPKAGEH